MVHELKPCPLCGGPATLKSVMKGPARISCWYVECDDCGLHQTKYKIEFMLDVVRKWNERVDKA